TLLFFRRSMAHYPHKRAAPPLGRHTGLGASHSAAVTARAAHGLPATPRVPPRAAGAGAARTTDPPTRHTHPLPLPCCQPPSLPPEAWNATGGPDGPRRPRPRRPARRAALAGRGGRST